ncbi:MAG: hypothetical protein LBK59_04330 [Bifidobacteriaceae bacterium]|nr:hypothetical protein [Bifidobacteriaceae bacterium]
MWAGRMVTASAAPGGFTPVASEVSYAWYAGNQATGDVVQEGASLSIDAGTEVGTEFTVAATAKAPGYAERTVTRIIETVEGTMAGGAVQVDGEVWAGRTVTATAQESQFTPQALTVTYTWYAGFEATGEVIASTSEFTIPSDAPAGTEFTVAATASVPGYADRTVTSTIKTVEGTIDGGSVDVAGNLWAGRTVTATADESQFRPQASTVTYAWYAGREASGEALASTAGFAIQPDVAVGSAFTVAATATVPGYADHTVTATIETVEGTIEGGSVDVIGDPWAGRTVTAAADGFTPDTPDVTYAWYAGDSAQGAPLVEDARFAIPAATGVGSDFTVVATVNAPGYTETTVSATVTTDLGTMSGGEIEVTGSPFAGETVTASADLASFVPTATSVTYAWYVGTQTDEPPVASSTEYVIPEGCEPGSTFTVVATATVPGYADKTVPATITSAEGMIEGGSVRVDGVLWAGRVVTASAETTSFDPEASMVSYVWYAGPAARGERLSANAEFTIPPGTPADSEFTVAATATRPGHAPCTVTKTIRTVEGEIDGGEVLVAGEVWAGRTVTASAGPFTPEATRVSYAWYAGDEVDDDALIVRAAALEIPPGTEVGTEFTVTATATVAGYGPATVTDTIHTVEGEIDDGEVLVAGEAWAGRTVTASAGSFTPEASGIAYVWYAGDRAEGEPLATGASLPIDASTEVGTEFTVAATATVPGYADLTVTETIQTVEGTIVGGAVVANGERWAGRTLVASAGTWSFTPEATSVSYAWYRGGAVDDDALMVRSAEVEIPSATPVGTEFTVAATATVPGYADLTVTETIQTVEGVIDGGEVVVDGEVWAGRTLVASAAARSFTPVASEVSYAWYAGDEATGDSVGDGAAFVVPLGTPVGTEFTVAATATVPGYADLTVTETIQTVEGTIVGGAVVAGGERWAGRTLAASAGTWSFTPEATEVSYSWYEGSEAHGEALASSAEFTIPAWTPVGTEFTVAATAMAPGYGPHTVTETIQTVQGEIDGGEVVVDGEAWAGRAVTASAGSFVPAASSIYYTWYAGNLALGEPVGTGAELQIPWDTPVGSEFTVAARARVPGYADRAVKAVVKTVEGTMDGGEVVVDGELWAGRTVTASAEVGSFDPEATSVSYAWYAGSTVMGDPVGAGAEFMIPVSTPVDTVFTVAATARRSGYGPVVATETIRTVEGSMVGGVVSVNGVPWAGRTVTASAAAGSFTPAATSVTYAWYAGEAADGDVLGDEPQYTIPPDTPVDTVFTVVATATVPGYGPRTVTTTIQTTLGTVDGGSVSVNGLAWADRAIVATADVDSFVPAASSVSYTWYAGNLALGEPVGTEPSYAIPAGTPVGTEFTVAATATVNGYADRTVKAVIETVQGTMSDGEVDVDGEPWAGLTVTASAGGFAPDATSMSYAWYPDDAVDGDPVATSREFAIPADASVGSRFTVVATAGRVGYGPATATATITTRPGAMTGGSIEVTGEAWAGRTVTASAESFTPPASSVSYAWYAGEATEGEALSNDAQYTIPAETDVGSEFTVVATATVPGYGPHTVSTTIETTLGAILGGLVHVSGDAWAGNTVTARAGGESFTPQVSDVSYVWYAGNLAEGAELSQTAVQEIPPGTPVGSEFTVEATARLHGYKERILVTTIKTVPGVATGGTVTITGDPWAGRTVSASSPLDSFIPAATTVSYAWYEGGEVQGDPLSRTAELDIPAHTRVGSEFTVAVTATVPGHVPLTVTETVATVEGVMADGSVGVTGEPWAARTVTASADAFTPPASDVSYAWYSGRSTAGEPLGRGVAFEIPAGTPSGSEFTVAATATASGYGDRTVTEVFITDQGVIDGGTVIIDGAAWAGRTITAVAPSASFTPTVSDVSFAWYAGDTATGPVLASAPDLAIPSTTPVGSEFTVEVTATAIGYGDLTITETIATSAGTIPEGVVSVNGHPWPGQTVTASASLDPSTPVAPDISYAWYAGDGTAGAKVSSTAEFDIPTTAVVGSEYTAAATIAAPGYTPSTAIATIVVVAGSLTIGELTVEGSPYAGNTVTVARPADVFSPSAETVEVRWFAGTDTSATPLATGATFTIPATAGAGSVFTVQATGIRPGFSSAVVTAIVTVILDASDPGDDEPTPPDPGDEDPDEDPDPQDPSGPDPDDPDPGVPDPADTGDGGPSSPNNPGTGGTGGTDPSSPGDESQTPDAPTPGDPAGGGTGGSTGGGLGASEHETPTAHVVDSVVTATVKTASTKPGKKPVIDIVVTAPNGPVPTGSVTIGYTVNKTKGSITADLTGGRATVTLPVKLAKKNGSYSVTVDYAGDTAVRPGHTSARMAPQITATLAKSSVSATTAASVKVSVKGSGVATPSGRAKVTVTNAKTKKVVKTKSVKVKVNKVTGSASIRLPKLPKGKYTITITYGGNNQVAPRTSKVLKLTVK